MTEFRMPSLGADMESGTLVEWLKQPGDDLRRGDVVAVVETQKGAIEIEIFEDGVLETVTVQPGELVPVGQVLATIHKPGEPAAAAMKAPVAEPEPVSRPAPPPKPAGIPVEIPRGTPLKITPVAFRRAAELGIDPTGLQPDSHGVIGLAQVEAAASRAVPRGGIDLTEMRKAIAAAMAKSKREIPHYYVSSTFDVTTLFDGLAAENASRPVAARLLYAVPLLKAMALALRKVPALNGAYGDDGFVAAERVNIGVAISLRGGGLIAPAIHDVDQAPLDDLMGKLTDLVARVRGGRLRSSELADATVTLSNMGDRSADALTPVIYPPQVAILGCGQIVERPWIVDGQVAVRHVLTATVAGDHRASDGLRAAQFLARFEQLLRRPEEL
jgi:pyruvate dehydrogenase E2 component (dihydrolipoamide acetyltransferase)